MMPRLLERARRLARGGRADAARPVSPEDRTRAARLRGLWVANAALLALLVFVLVRQGEAPVDPPERDLPGGARAAAPLAVRAPAAPSVAGERRETEPAPAPPPHAIDRALQAELRGIVAAAVERARAETRGRADASNVVVGLHVRELGVAGELAALDADRALRPASNMKLVTTAAALVMLGADWSFRTRFESSAAVEGGALRGELVVRAGADPFFDPAAEGEAGHLLAPAVRALRDAGIERIEGDLVLDEGGYLAPGPGPGWPSDDQYWQEHCARCAGFSAGAGCLEAVVEATEPGRRAQVRVHPRDHGLEPSGEVVTRPARSALRVAVEARPPRVTVRGELPADVPRWSARFAHPDPVELFGAVLRGELARGGIELGGAVVRDRGRPPARLLAELRTPLVPLLAPINTDSNNAVADQVFLALGAETGGSGDREGGARAVRAALERLGVPATGLVQVDGSGLSREDRASARQVTALIDAVEALGGDAAAAWRDSLALAGETGTLADRMRDGAARGRVRAKTGWISGTSALSGVVETEGGRRLAFSILVDYPRLAGLNNSCWKPMQDAVCEALVGWDGGS